MIKNFSVTDYQFNQVLLDCATVKLIFNNINLKTCIYYQDPTFM